MLALWAGYALVLSLCVGVVAFATERVLAIWALPRRMVWLTAILVTVLVPVFMAARPVPVARPALRALVSDVALSARSAVVRSRVAPRPFQLRWRAVATRISPYFQRAWTIASLITLGLFARGLIGLARKRAGWRADRVRGDSVLIAPDAGPAVVGVLRPQVVVPEWALTLGGTDLALLLRHEREHLDAGDPRTLLVATLALILFPWNIALFWMAHRLRLSIEIDCDARVLRAIDAPHEYGLLLVAVGERRSFALPLSAALAERRSLLERRIHAMTTLRPRRPIVASLPFAAIAAAASIAAAQASPPPVSGVVTRASIEARFVDSVATARISSVTTVTPAEMHALLSMYHPGALEGDPSMGRIAIVLDANDNYVKSVVRAPVTEVAATSTIATFSGAASASAGATDSARALEERAITEVASARAAASATAGTSVGIVSRRTGTADFNVSVSSPHTYGDARIAGIGEIRGEDIRAIEAVTYGAGEMGTMPLHVLIIKLK